MNDELHRAFQETHFIVYHQPPFTLRIGQPSPELDALLQASGYDCAAFITAWNPMCQTLDVTENQRRQQSLKSELDARDLIALLGIGQHPSNGWPGEESILVLGLQFDAARALAKTYGQLAFVWVDINQPAELIEA
jgi:hypothetical protein